MVESRPNVRHGHWWRRWTQDFNEHTGASHETSNSPVREPAMYDLPTPPLRVAGVMPFPMRELHKRRCMRDRPFKLWSSRGTQYKNNKKQHALTAT